MRALLAAILASFACLAPAGADQLLPQPQIDGSGNVKFRGGPTIGKADGSVLDLSAMKVVPGGGASPRTLAEALRIGGGAASVAATGGTLTLSEAQLASRVIKITGTLVSNLVVDFPAAQAGSWSLINATSGAYGVTAQVAGQVSGALVVPAGQPRTVSSDGATLTSPVSQATGLTTPTSTVTGNFAAWGGVNGQALVDVGFGAGTGGHALPFLDGANAWSGAQTFTAGASILGAANPGLTIGTSGGQSYTFGRNTGALIFGLYDVTGGRFRVACKDASLNCGINTANPGAVLDVAGTLRGQALLLAGAPTASDIPASYWTVVKRSDDASVKVCMNDGGAIKCAALVP